MTLTQSLNVSDGDETLAEQIGMAPDDAARAVYAAIRSAGHDNPMARRAAERVPVIQPCLARSRVTHRMQTKRGLVEFAVSKTEATT